MTLKSNKEINKLLLIESYIAYIYNLYITLYNCMIFAAFAKISLTILATGVWETALMKKGMSSGCYSSSELPLRIISSSSLSLSSSSPLG